MRVLVVVDDTDVRTVMRLNLELEGMQVREATTAVDGAVRVAAGEWQGSILNLGVGDDRLAGLGAVGESPAFTPPAVVALVAGTPTKPCTRSRPARACARKPFSPQTLAETVSDLAVAGPGERQAERSASARVAQLRRLGVDRR